MSDVRERARPAAAESPADVAVFDESTCVACGSARESGDCAHCGAVATAGPYRIEGLVTQNERGRMYLAVGPDGRRVALKELVYATVPSASEIEAFEREGRVLEALDHPRIPKFVAAFRTGTGIATRLYLAQEFVEGESLAKRLTTRRYDEREVIALAREVLAILRFLHERTPRLLHRDVKPANLLVRPGGEVVLVDFGSAREVRGGFTHRATLVGTFGYVPVEQLGGSVGPSSDLYALGATLVHLLSRRAPHELFDGSFQIRLDSRVNVSDGLCAILEKLVARDPSARYQRAVEVLAALAALEREEASVPVAPAPSKRRRAWPWLLAATLALGAGGYLATRPTEVVVAPEVAVTPEVVGAPPLVVSRPAAPVVDPNAKRRTFEAPGALRPGDEGTAVPVRVTVDEVTIGSREPRRFRLQLTVHGLPDQSFDPFSLARFRPDNGKPVDATFAVTPVSGLKFPSDPGRVILFQRRGALRVDLDFDLGGAGGGTFLYPDGSRYAVTW